MSILGIAFPFQKGATEFPAKATDDDVIEQNIQRILLTRRGERVMRPGSGSDTMSFVFENVGPTLQARINREVRRALAEGEPRVVVRRVQSGERPNQDTGGTQVIVVVTYEVGGQIQKTAVVLASL